MAANGISTLPTKRERQDAKLALATTNRAASGRRSVADATQLPTRYGVGSNAAADIIDNPNPGGLVPGRPWSDPVTGGSFSSAWGLSFKRS